MTHGNEALKALDGLKPGKEKAALCEVIEFCISRVN